MKEVAASGHDCYRKCLRTRPVKHCRQRDRVVLFAVDDERFCMRARVNRRDRIAACSGADQHQLVYLAQRLELGKGVRGDKGAERKPGQRQRSGGRCVLHHREQIVQLATTFVMAAEAAANAPKIKAHRRPAALRERTGQRLHHLVVQRAAEQGMGMGDHGDPAGRPGGSVARDFEPAGRAGKA